MQIGGALEQDGRNTVLRQNEGDKTQPGTEGQGQLMLLVR